MDRGSTLFLRGVILLIGAFVLALCVFALPAGLRDARITAYHPMLLGLYVTAVPFFITLYQALKLLSYIDTNKAFSDASVSVLKIIKYCAVVIGLLFAAGLPYIRMVAHRDDMPGVMALGAVICFASFVIATFAAVLQKLLKSAIEIKSENDLTV